MNSQRASQFFDLLNAHLAHRNTASMDKRGRGDLSIIAEGAAFELWLSFEARVVMERNRDILRLPRKHFWTANEHKKLDLSAWPMNCGEEQTKDGENRCPLAVEFKVIHNNKNWKKKCNEVWHDLLPPASSAKAGLPVDERVSVVAVVFKTYADPDEDGYPGQQRDKRAWLGRVEEELATWDEANRRTRIRRGLSFPIRSPHLDKRGRADHSGQLWLVGLQAEPAAG